ncbi:histidine kinase [Paractinoplanes ferrugineus]|uniref:histidine kinase n=1 Tax=Paractinoplanes ferrugineus TaxID=113564 RepID=A0A919JC85_9ACTN|nr:histidine kinase [Actinoplanes ferrugineus]GIE16659.1 two-component sensor histidine kinase [Actinoplanes ferrugineus]
MTVGQVTAWWRAWLSDRPRRTGPSRAGRRVAAAIGRHATAVDVGLAALAAAGTLPQLYHHAIRSDPRIGVFVLFSALLVIPLGARRRLPLTTFAGAATVALTQWLAGVPLAADLTLLIYLYTVASRYPVRVAIGAAGVVEVGALLAAVRWPGIGSWAGSTLWTGTFVLLSGPVVAVLMLGVTVRHRRAAIDALTQRAAHLERERDQQAAIAVAAERTRIAREMHDVIAHTLSVMVTLSEGAARKQATEPVRAGEAMRQVSITGRQALAEMRRLLGVLHTEPAPGDRHPQPGLAQLDDLLEQVRSTGLTVAAAVTGTPAGMPPGAELTVYRIVQEALTNALKHATAANRVSVAIAHHPGSVTVDVHDDGAPAAPRRRTGHGLAGMRDRAAVYAGEVSAGPDPDGGWRVRARLALPIEAATR